jgi:hypothetical protein
MFTKKRIRTQTNSPDRKLGLFVSMIYLFKMGEIMTERHVVIRGRLLPNESQNFERLFDRLGFVVSTDMDGSTLREARRYQQVGIC